MDNRALTADAPLVLEAHDVTYVLDTSPGVLVLSVCTEKKHPGLVNFRVSLERLGYEYEILALGQTWKGWRWRTATYIARLERLEEEQIVLLSDCTDVLFVEGPRELERRFRALKTPVLVGAETDMSTGRYRYDLTERKRVRERYAARDPAAIYRFPNGGLILGYRTPLLRLLRANADAEDDQAGLVAMYDEEPRSFRLDVDARLLGNLVQRASFFDEDREVHERSRWRIVWSVDVGSGRRRLGVVNELTGGSPCVLHFAGGNRESYNEIGGNLLGPIHQSVTASRKDEIKQFAKKPWSGVLSWMVR
jgi:hypothetical protein